MERTHHQVKAERAKKAWMLIQNQTTSKQNKQASLERQLQKI
ncbi:hypothetical protein [Zobellia uliginosa]|nr:hypothetical protein [Zobellia uliginosa]